MNSAEKRWQLKVLSDYVTDHKKHLISEVLSRRTKFVTVVLEDIFQSQNASAVMRSCDCFGIQDLYVIENRNEYSINPHVSLGSSKWVSLQKFSKGKDNTVECLTSLKEKGYRLVATTPDPNAVSLYDFKLEKPIALLFGTELTGLSENAMEMADERVRIPMYGFTESFNISVSAALCLSIVREKLQLSDLNFGLTDEEMMDIRLEWYKKIVKRSDLFIDKARMRND